MEDNEKDLNEWWNNLDLLDKSRIHIMYNNWKESLPK
jgi:hypothetical protein